MHIVLTIAAILGVLMAGMVLLVLFAPGLRVRRTLRKAPIETARAAPEGVWVRIVGTARPTGSALRSPVSDRVAVAYEIDASYHSEDGGNVGPLRLTRAVAFEIDDGSGIALVSEAASVRLSLETAASSRVTACDAPEEVLAGLEPRVSNVRREKHGTVAIEEGVLEPGERVAVAGVARWQSDGGAEARLVLAPHPDHGILVSDAPAAIR